MGHHIVMGRKTYESIGRPLPNRTNIVLTRTLNYSAAPFVHVVSNFNQAIQLADRNDENELMIIGGKDIFDATLPVTSRIYFSRIHGTFEGDIFWDFVLMEEWELKKQWEHHRDEQNVYDCTFYIYERKTPVDLRSLLQ
jgi:dihydrofolate reductase